MTETLRLHNKDLKANHTSKSNYKAPRNKLKNRKFQQRKSRGSKLKDFKESNENFRTENIIIKVKVQWMESVVDWRGEKEKSVNWKIE